MSSPPSDRYRIFQKPIQARVEFPDDDFKRIVPFVATLTSNGITNAAAFNTDHAVTETPTQYLTTDPWFVQYGMILEIAYQINPTTAETYQIMLFEGKAGTKYDIASKMLYQSAALLVDDTYYLIQDRQVIFNLDEIGKIYYNTDWTGAAGVTSGLLRVSGVCYI